MRLQRQNIKLTTSNEEPFQKIMQGTLIEKFLNQPFNKSWTTSIRIETKGVELWLEIQLEQDFSNSLFQIFDQASLVTSEVIGSLSKQAAQPQSSEAIIVLSVENFIFKEGNENLTSLCTKDGLIRLKPKIVQLGPNLS